MLEDVLRQILYVTMRWLHIVSVTLIVGGTLFFQFVFPIAIEDLKREQQLALFGKARWVFKRVVWVCGALLVISGTISIHRLWGAYQQGGPSVVWFGILHILLAVVSLAIAMSLTYGGRPPEHPIGWMRVNLTVLLITILAANIARNNRIVAGSRWQPTPAAAREVQMRPESGEKIP